MELEIEVWKDVVGYEGLYQVSSWGNVKALNYKKSGKERNMSKSISGKYLTVNLRLNKVGKTHTVHQLVAMAFHGHVPNGFKIVIDHIDNNKLNNRADNIKLVSARQNCSKDKKDGASKYTGVSWKVSSKKWVAAIIFKKRVIHLGYFDVEIDAKNAYDKALAECEQGLDLNILYPKSVKSSQYEWVYLDKRSGKWEARYKGKFLGYFNTELEAYEARENYIKQLQAISESTYLESI